MKVIVVLGMHRSGTSALTRVINLCGAALPRTLMRIVPDENETGFWESDLVAQANDQIFLRNGGSWYDISLIDPGKFYYEDTTQDEIYLAQLLLSEFPVSEMIVLKDPRISLLVPIWLRVFERLSVEPHFFVMVRHPLEVAASLTKRNGLTSEQGMYLWLRYTVDAIFYSREYKQVFVTYDQVLEDWQSVIRAANDALAIDLEWTVGSVKENVSRFLDKNLKHNIVGQQTSALPTWVNNVYSWTLDRANGKNAEWQRFLKVREEMIRAAEVYAPIICRFSPDLEPSGGTDAKT